LGKTFPIVGKIYPRQFTGDGSIPPWDDSPVRSESWDFVCWKNPKPGMDQVFQDNILWIEGLSGILILNKNRSLQYAIPQPDSYHLAMK
jgi:hypothetical protein